VPFGEERLIEAQKHGFRRALIPAGNRPRKALPSLEVHAVERLDQALRFVRPAAD
jgi:DNA repair protein RadA/Sms